jgi:inner membrane protein involved in colicin E2 resistance
MITTSIQTRTPRATSVALLVFTLCFVLVVYTVTHEAGHAVVGVLFGQTLTAFKVNFLTLSAHVGLVGELTHYPRIISWPLPNDPFNPTPTCA